MTTATPMHGILPALADKAVPVEQLHAHPLNARRRDPRAKAAIRESLQEHGQYRTTFARRLPDGRIEMLGGHGTLEQAIELGWTHLAVDVHDGVDDQRAAKMVAVDNRTSDLASYDQDRLAELLAAAGDLAATGYTQPDYDELLARNATRAGRAALTDPDAAPPRPEQPHTKLGQTWLLGEHRLVIGDGTNPAVVDAALGGQPADLYLSDPPYNVDYTGKTAQALKIDNDHQDAAAFGELLDGLFSAAAECSRPGAPAYVFHADTEGLAFRSRFGDAGWELKQVLVWIKDRFVLGRQDHHWQHEPILYGWKPGAAHTWLGGRTLTTLLDDELDLGTLKAEEMRAMLRELREEATAIRHDRPARSTLHPTMKPVSMLVQLLERSSRPGALVLDSCGGSGATLIACHTAGRRAGLVELDPRYGDVICRRYEEHTGIVPILEGSGARSFAA